MAHGKRIKVALAAAALIVAVLVIDRDPAHAASADTVRLERSRHLFPGNVELANVGSDLRLTGRLYRDRFSPRALYRGSVIVEVVGADGRILSSHTVVTETRFVPRGIIGARFSVALDGPLPPSGFVIVRPGS